MKSIKALQKSLPVLQSCPSVQPACRWGRSLRPRQLWMPPLKRNNTELLTSFFHEKYTVRAKFKVYLRRSSCRQGRTAAWSYLRSSNLFLQEEKPIWLFNTETFFQCALKFSANEIGAFNWSQSTDKCEVITGWLWPLHICNKRQQKISYLLTPQPWHSSTRAGRFLSGFALPTQTLHLET